MKYALDTSVLVRILVNMPQPLASEVIADVARRIAVGDTMVVPSSFGSLLRRATSLWC